MPNNNEKTFEILFDRFLHSDPGGVWGEDLAAAMHTVSAEIDAQIEAGAVDPDTVADYELAAMRYGFYEGLIAGLDLVASKARLALNRQRGLVEEPEED